MVANKKFEQIMANNYGSEHFYKHFIPSIIFTDGIRAVAEEFGAFWLIDMVASYMPDVIKKYQKDEETFFTVRLKVKPDNTADFSIFYYIWNEEKEDEDIKNLVTQHIGFTDFPASDTGEEIEYDFYLQLSHLNPVMFTFFLTSEY